MKPYEEEIDYGKINDPETTLDDLSDEEYEWLEENDPDRLAEIGDETNERYRDEMFPDGEDDDQSW